MSRRPRQLSEEERRLWEAVARAARPLRGKKPGKTPSKTPGKTLPVEDMADRISLDETPGPVAPGSGRPDGVDAPRRDRGARPAASSPVLPPVGTAGLARRQARALARGRQAAESVVDLHGLTQLQAHATLARFLRGAQSSGQSLVLVVTGKGRPAGGLDPAPGGHGERGILRRMVPHWLGLPELRGIVVGFEEAATRQGGGGALYVRLRRRRAADWPG